jgi:hypothetical protein
MGVSIMSNRLILAAALGVLGPSLAHAQASYPWHDRVQPVFTAEAWLDMASRDFIYRYTVQNSPTAEQRINIVRIPVAVPASTVTPPPQWTVMYEPGLPEVFWFADGEVDPSWLPASDGDVASFRSEITPGGSLSGFELRSPCAQGMVTFRANGYNHMRTLEDDSLPGQVPPDTPDDAVSGTITGPSDCNTILDWGSQKAATDGFMGVVNFTSGTTMPPGPALVQIHFSRNGEVVNVSTFRAQLNRRDVTGSFARNSRGDMVAMFSPGSSPAVRGENQLQISVDGVVVATGRTATDTQKTMFILP